MKDGPERLSLIASTADFTVAYAVSAMILARLLKDLFLAATAWLARIPAGGKQTLRTLNGAISPFYVSLLRYEAGK